MTKINTIYYSNDNYNTDHNYITTEDSNYEITGLTHNTEYKVKIKANDNGLESPYSLASTVRTAVYAPIALSHTDDVAGQSLLAWSYAYSATTFKLYVYDNTASAFVSGYNGKSISGATFSELITILIDGHNYSFYLKAVIGSYESASSNLVTFTYNDELLDSIPTVSAATSITSSGFTANFAAVGTPDNLKIYISTDNFVTSTSYIISASDTTYIFTGLTADTPYKYKVTAIISGVESSYNTPISVTTESDVVVDSDFVIDGYTLLSVDYDNDVNDNSGNGNNGTFNGSYEDSFINPPKKSGLFDGVDDYTIFSGVTTTNKSFTAAIIMQFVSWQTTNFIYTNYNQNSSNGVSNWYVFYNHSDEKFYIYLYGESVTYRLYSSGTVTLATNTTYKIKTAWDHAGKTLLFTLNDSPISLTSFASNISEASFILQGIACEIYVGAYGQDGLINKYDPFPNIRVDQFAVHTNYRA